MSSVAQHTDTQSQLAVLFQYTIEAYKTFEKLAEIIPNPLSAGTFQRMANTERTHRDILEIRYLEAPGRMSASLGSDMSFMEILEGRLSGREIAEWLISREKSMQKRLEQSVGAAPDNERELLLFVAAAKHANIVALERELALLRRRPDWFDREDAEHIIAHGTVE